MGSCILTVSVWISHEHPINTNQKIMYPVVYHSMSASTRSFLFFYFCAIFLKLSSQAGDKQSQEQNYFLGPNNYCVEIATIFFNFHHKVFQEQKINFLTLTCMSKSEKPRIQPGSEGWSTKVSGGKGMSILLQVKPSSEDKYRRLLVQSVKITWKKK